ncbi:MAG TPA: cysteine peptidase family C39 domain-containing protein [Myxococcaceae bacterium]|nr:cysteine peptidase family C39 domain-containing protein [Myxococcaceae bacterium]
MSSPSTPRRRLVAPEVIQTSAMDCGPAALKCLLEGFGTSVSYGRLREACQTDVDGTSIDTLEEVARQLGLDAEQVMLPVDHLLLPEGEALPALLVVRLPNGYTHFVVVWAVQGGLVQVMDPAAGRHWMTPRRLLDETYAHTMPVPASAWREWAGSEEFSRALTARLRELGVDAARAGRWLEEALADPGWRPAAALDAATRMVAALVRSGGVDKGRSAAGLIEALAARARSAEDDAEELIPEPYWMVRSFPPDEEGERLRLSGAVLVRVRGLLGGAEARERPLSPELTAALEEPPARPGRALWNLLEGEGGGPMLAAVGAGVVLAALGLMAQALVFRGLVDLSRILGSGRERLVAMGVAVALTLALLLVELPVASALRRLGRGLEVRLRMAFLEALPRLNDRYFSSRPTSDMAHRGHEAHVLRQMPEIAGRAARAGFELFATVGGLVWLAPAHGWLAVLAGLSCVGVPLVAQPVLGQWDLRVRTHSGGLSRFYLDSLLGLMAIRTHGAERAIRREHESLLVEWARAASGFVSLSVRVEAAQAVLGFGLAAALIWSQLSQAGPSGGLLLLAYWALNLPVLGQEVALVAREYPTLRNITLRLLEPLGAKDVDAAEPPAAPPPSGAEPVSTGVAVSMKDVSVLATGHTLLSGLDLEIPAGSHVAIVGPSGAGKSSFAGLLLGWHRAASGEVRVDGRLLDRDTLAGLLPHVAWVDPTAHLWNRTLLSNLQYGAPDAEGARVGEVLHQAELISLLEHLPDGLQTELGEGGALVSGGEGQRVRLGRAMLRRQARLVILDEPFRGLDRERRHALLRKARALWQGATLLCITHDVKETLAFERVLVLEGGRVVEDGVPSELEAREGSRYRALGEAEVLARDTLWGAAGWRRLRIEEGSVRVDAEGEP